MLRTRVGYAGGKKDKPTYRSIGDHTEALQIEFDPSVITYEKLLEVFWRGHDPFGRAWSTQYKAVLWTHGEAQAKAAKASIAKLTEQNKRKPTTEVKAATTFWIAEDYHQKYYLRGRRGLVEALMGENVTQEAIRESTLAARVNGWLTGFSKKEEIAAQVKAFKLTEKQRKALQDALGKRSPMLCK